MPSTSSGVTSLVLRRTHDLTVLHHADAVGQIEDIVDVVADEEDADALGLELLDQFADLRGFLRPERRRRFVHDQDAGVEMDGARNRHRLALAAGQLRHRLLEAAEVGIEPVHHLAAFGLHGDVIQRAIRASCSSRPR